MADGLWYAPSVCNAPNLAQPAVLCLCGVQHWQCSVSTHLAHPKHYTWHIIPELWIHSEVPCLPGILVNNPGPYRVPTTILGPLSIGACHHDMPDSRPQPVRLSTYITECTANAVLASSKDAGHVQGVKGCVTLLAYDLLRKNQCFQTSIANALNAYYT